MKRKNSEAEPRTYTVTMPERLTSLRFKAATALTALIVVAAVVYAVVRRAGHALIDTHDAASGFSTIAIWVTIAVTVVLAVVCLWGGWVLERRERGSGRSLVIGMSSAMMLLSLTPAFALISAAFFAPTPSAIVWCVWETHSLVLGAVGVALGAAFLACTRTSRVEYPDKDSYERARELCASPFWDEDTYEPGPAFLGIVVAGMLGLFLTTPCLIDVDLSIPVTSWSHVAKGSQEQLVSNNGAYWALAPDGTVTYFTRDSAGHIVPHTGKSSAIVFDASLSDHAQVYTRTSAKTKAIPRSPFVDFWYTGSSEFAQPFIPGDSLQDVTTTKTVHLPAEPKASR